MRFLSGQWASVVANCTLFGLLWWMSFHTFSWACCTYGVCQFVSLVFQTVVPKVHNINVDDLSGALHLWGRFVVLEFWWILCVGEWLVNVVVIENYLSVTLGVPPPMPLHRACARWDIPRSSFVWSRHVSKSWFPYTSSSQQSGWLSVESGRLRFTYFGECVCKCWSKFFIFDESFPGFPMSGMWHLSHCFRLFMRESHWAHSTRSNADCVLMARSLFDCCGCGRCFVCKTLVCDFEQAFGDDECNQM